MSDCRTAHENPGERPGEKPVKHPVPHGEARHAAARTRVSAGRATSCPENTEVRLPKGASALRSPTRRTSGNTRWSVPCNLTDRDRAVLRSIERFRVLTTPQLARLHFDSHSRASARLLDLRAHRLLDRFRPYREGWGAHPRHWVLDALGAAVLAGERGEDAGRAGRRWRGEYTLAYSSSQRLAHVLGINDVYVSLAARARHNDARHLDWLTERECAAWTDGIVRPDGWGVWQEDRQSVEFFLEYDRGTEALGRLVDKLAAYERFEDQRGVSAWVLFAFTSARREQTARHALADATVPVAAAALVDGVEPHDAAWLPLRAAGDWVRLAGLADVPKPPAAIARAAAGMAVRAMSSRLLLRPEEAAEVLGIGRSKLYELLAAGVIESVQIGSARRVPVEGLHDFVRRLRAAGQRATA